MYIIILYASDRNFYLLKLVNELNKCLHDMTKTLAVFTIKKNTLKKKHTFRVNRYATYIIMSLFM